MTFKESELRGWEVARDFFLQKATVTWNLIYGKKMKPSAEKPLVSPKAIICCGVFHIADRGRHWKYVEVSEKMVFLAGLQISQILSLVISCKMSKPQKKKEKKNHKQKKVSGCSIHIFQIWKPKFRLIGSSSDGYWALRVSKDT